MATASDIERTRVLSISEEHFLNIAFTFAREALAAQEVPVGCIFVLDGDVVIARGRNEVNVTRNATRHAEMICVDQTVQYCHENALNCYEIWPKIDVYVTVEPCIMCAAALYNLPVRSVVFGCRNDRFGGETVLDVAATMKNCRTKVSGGFRADEAMELLKQFYKGTNPNAPAAKVRKQPESTQSE